MCRETRRRGAVLAKGLNFKIKLGFRFSLTILFFFFFGVPKQMLDLFFMSNEKRNVSSTLSLVSWSEEERVRDTVNNK